MSLFYQITAQRESFLIERPFGKPLGHALFRRRPAPPAPGPASRVQVPGWTEQQVAIAHALTDTAISTIMVQPVCAPTLEGLAWAVERDLPAGAQAQIEMARFSGPAVEAERGRARRA